MMKHTSLTTEQMACVYAWLAQMFSRERDGEGLAQLQSSEMMEWFTVLKGEPSLEADVLLLDNPTQGVDVGAKAEIYRLILEFAARGMTVIINTLEIPEIKKVSDRCVVFFEGRVAKVFQHDEINEHDVMLYSTNAINTRGGANHAG